MSIKRDSRGYAFSLDLLLALIPITIVLGMVAGDVDNMMYQVQDTVFRGSMDRVAFDTMNTLLETSGTPTNWEETGNPSVAGLAIYDPSDGPLEGTIDTNKLPSLTQGDVQNLIGDDYDFFMKVTYLKDGTLVKSLGTYNSGADDIVRVERVAIYSNLKIVSQAKDLIRYTGTPRVYSNPPDPFQTSKYYLQTYDYYVLLVNRGYSSVEVNINNERVFDPNDIRGSQDEYATLVKLIDPKALYNETELQNNTVDVRGTSTPGSSLDVYIVQVVKGTPKEDVNLDSVVPQKVKFELYIWPR
ncbi:hypothetical protein DSECCO2_140880 [anaerobic digester metagenome]